MPVRTRSRCKKDDFYLILHDDAPRKRRKVISAKNEIIALKTELDAVKAEQASLKEDYKDLKQQLIKTQDGLTEMSKFQLKHIRALYVLAKQFESTSSPISIPSFSG